MTETKKDKISSSATLQTKPQHRKLGEKTQIAINLADFITKHAKIIPIPLIESAANIVQAIIKAVNGAVRRKDHCEKLSRRAEVSWETVTTAKSLKSQLAFEQYRDALKAIQDYIEMMQKETKWLKTFYEKVDSSKVS